MKITRIRLNCSRSSPVAGEESSDAVLVYFHTPAILTGIGEKRLRKGTAVIFSSGHKQQFRPSAPDKPVKYDHVGLRLTNADKQYIASLSVPFDLPVELHDDFVASGILKCMKSHSLRKGHHTGEFMELSMRLLFIMMSEAIDPPVPEKTKSIPRFAELKALREAIYDDPMNTWSADEICDDLGVSRAYFHRLYLEAFGVTCRQDVIESRLLYAADLLKNTDLSVSAVAEQCGYDSDSYFMRQFKKHKGCTPSEYRQRSELD